MRENWKNKMSLINDVIIDSGLSEACLSINQRDKKCYVNEKYALTLGDFRCTERGLEHLCKQTQKLNDNGHWATRVIDYKIVIPGVWPLGYTLMDTAPGSSAYTSLTDMINESKWFFDKIVEDYLAIVESKLAIDPYSGDNFRYIPGKLSFIDLFPFMTQAEIDSSRTYFGDIYILDFFKTMLEKQIKQPKCIKEDLCRALCNDGHDLRPRSLAVDYTNENILAFKISSAIRRRKFCKLFHR